MASRRLTRKFVSARLSEYYAQPADKVVGVSAAIPKDNLSSHLGQWHWRRVLQNYYEEREGHWLTPVELFQPHFSNILGDFCCHSTTSRSGNEELEIIELGGGRGTNAKLILSYLQEHKPSIYENVIYTIVDSSPTLHRLQRSVFEDNHSDKVKFQQVDLLDVAEQKTSLLDKSDKPTIVIAMEVLDNLPHDKIQGKTKRKIQQSEIIGDDQIGDLQETFYPLKDPLISRVIQRVPSFAKSYPVWIPTVACGVLEHIIQRRQNLGLVFADFDWLPAPDLVGDNDLERQSVWAEGEPIVTDMDGVDFECMLQAPPHCDILFPTDFENLGSFTKRALIANGRKTSSVSVEKQADFLERVGSTHVQRTKSWLSGHTPLLHDFANCSVLSIVTTDVSQ